MSNLIALIDKVDEIRELFTTEYMSLVKPAGRPSIQSEFRTIRKNNEYLNWKAEIEAELDNIPQTKSIDEIRRLFKKIDGGWTEEIEFDRLAAKLKALRSRISVDNAKVVQDEESKFQESDLNHFILHALINVQKTKLYHGQSEDDINDGVRNALDMVYEIKDQTRQGKSESGKKSGELDILLCKKSMPWAIVEALRLFSLDKDNLDKHINKALTKYDPVGCKNAYVLVYGMATDFNSFWNNIVSYLKDYKFPFETIDEFTEIPSDYAESKIGVVSLDRNGVMVKLHIMVANMK